MSATVTDIYRYPVKSVGGQRLEHATLASLGIPGDRCWALRSTDDGSIKIGKRSPLPQGMEAAFLEEPDGSTPSPAVRITLPDGTSIRSDQPGANQALSAALDSPIALQSLLPPDEQLTRNPPPPGTDVMAMMRELFARTPDEPLPDLRVIPETLSKYEAPPGTWFDAFPILVLSHQTLATLAAARPESNFDVRRFRPNIVVEASGDGFPENAWAGRRGRLGSAILQFEMACPRCIMTTHGFDDLPKDPGVMRALVQNNDGNAGIYASVAEPGTFRTGDTIELLD